MPLSPRIIRGRIKSVSNTKKITKAMELVAASKMRKSVQSVLGSRPYAEAAWRAVGMLASGGVREHSLLAPASLPADAIRAGTRSALILFASDRGLCGGYNSQMLRLAAQFIREQGKPVDIVAVGRKAQDFARRRGLPLIAAFESLTNKPAFIDVRPVARLAIDAFSAGTYADVFLGYTDFRSALVQKPSIKRFLPLGRNEGLGAVGGVLDGGRPEDATEAKASPRSGAGDMLFEPSTVDVLDAILPRIAESQVWQALLESAASEHSARMLAMRSATDNADDMIGWLTLSYNQARQAGITREIAEISAGKAALE